MRENKNLFFVREENRMNNDSKKLNLNADHFLTGMKKGGTLRQQIESTTGSSLSPEQAKFRMAIHYWEKGDFREAEKWLRLSYMQGYSLAQHSLELGIHLGFFLGTRDRFRTFAVELLEHFVTPAPTEEHIKSLEVILLNYLEAEYGLGKAMTN